MTVVHPGLPQPGLNPEDAAAAHQLAVGVLGLEPQQPPAAEPTSAPEQPKLYAGKYPSLEEWEKGHWELHNTLKARESALSQQTERINALEQLLVTRAHLEDQNRKSPYDSLNESGVPADMVREAVRMEIQQALAPIAAGARAQQTVRSQFPEYATSENEVAQFLEVNPSLAQRYGQLYNADPAAAMEWAFLRYRDARASQPRTPAPTAPAARADAALPSSQMGERSAPTADNGERMQQAVKYMQTYKDPTPVVHERLRGLIPDSHFTQE
jgi:hypothetical protein